jgi:chromosome partitioning protein
MVSLPRAHEILGRKKSSGGGKAPILAVAAQKGGVGKTTTSVHLAWVLAQEFHRKVLLVDLDAQGHVGTHLLNHARVETTKKLGACLLERRGSIGDVAVSTDVEKLNITRPDKGLHHVEIQLNAKIGKEFVLEKALAPVRDQYDVIILDCPPNLGNLTVSALVASTAVLVPADPGHLAINGVQDILETLEVLDETFNKAPELLGVVLCRVDRRSRSLNQEIRQKMNRIVPGGLLDIEVPAQSAVARAQLKGTTVFSVDPRGAVAEAYRALTEVVMAQLSLGTRLTRMRGA